jgi:hypothetical protein
LYFQPPPSDEENTVTNNTPNQETQREWPDAEEFRHTIATAIGKSRRYCKRNGIVDDRGVYDLFAFGAANDTLAFIIANSAEYAAELVAACRARAEQMPCGILGVFGALPAHLRPAELANAAAGDTAPFGGDGGGDGGDDHRHEADVRHHDPQPPAVPPEPPAALEAHPFADAFPLIEGAEFDELVADIRQYGLREEIVRYQGKILDGRNRYRACLAAEVEPRFKEFTGNDSDALAFVISANLKRRHLSESQRAMAAAKLATLRDGQRADLVEGTSIEGASKLLNVGHASVERARKVLDHGTAELQREVQAGHVSVSAAADIASRPAHEQDEIVARGRKEILEAARRIRTEDADARLSQLRERAKSLQFPGD